jgi:hypothetical protein
MNWIAAFFEMLSMYLVGNKRRIGFLTFVCGSCCWAIVAIIHHLYGLFVVAFICASINVRNYLKWKKNL